MIYNMSDNLPQPKAHIPNNWGKDNQSMYRISIKRLKLHSTTKRNSQWSNLEILIYNIQRRLTANKLEAMLSRIVDISCTLDLSRLSYTILSAISGNELGGTKSGSSSMILKAG